MANGMWRGPQWRSAAVVMGSAVLAAACAEPPRAPEAASRSVKGGTSSPTALPAGVTLSPRSDDPAITRLCGVLATRTLAPVALPDLPISDTAPPRLLQRVIGSAAVIGVRFVVPGRDAAYAFEGLTATGGHRISRRQPVSADPSRPIPVGAPDSLIDVSLSPAPAALDAELLGLTALASPPYVPTGDGLQAPRIEDAVPVVTDLPFFEARLSDACPDITLRLGVVARMDKRIKIPVRRGDRIAAHAVALAGVARVSFDEAGPPPVVPRLAPVPTALVEAANDGVVTLRVALFVADKAQAAGQEVLVHVSRRSATAGEPIRR